MDDHPTSGPGQPASTGQDSAKDLARTRRRWPLWHITKGAGSDPLGYAASRDGCHITAPNLLRLGDRIADAERSWPSAGAEGADR